jgi:hypothetical protein
MPSLILCILIFVDSCKKQLLGGAKYFISFIDDYSQYTYVYHLNYFFEAFVMFQAYKAFVEK